MILIIPVCGILSSFQTRLCFSQRSFLLRLPSCDLGGVREGAMEEECATVKFTVAIAMPVRTMAQKMGTGGGEKAKGL